MRSFFVFDVESVGLHGEGFAVAGGVYLENGAVQWEFSFACDPEHAISDGKESERWVRSNVPLLELTHRLPHAIRSAFWAQWVRAKNDGVVMVVDCGWPVEARFLLSCIADDFHQRKNDGPYPMLDLSSLLFAAGKDPLATLSRLPSEEPRHNPLADARQSARILSETLAILKCS